MTVKVKLDMSELERIRNKVAEFEGAQRVPLTDLLSDDLIRQHTRFQSLQAMLDAAGVKSQEDIETEAFSNFVKANSRWESWDDLCRFAGMRYFEQKGREIFTNGEQ